MHTTANSMPSELTGETLRTFSRREILKGAAAGGAALAAAGSAAVAMTSEPDASWDYETDVVVVGFGGAGGASAVSAADNGADVIIVERDAYENRLSNTRMSNAIFHSPDPDGDFEGLKE